MFGIFGVWRLLGMFFLVPDIKQYQERPDCPDNHKEIK